MNLEKYNQERDIQTGKSCYKFSPCIAPFNNMYFAVRGQVSPCWLSSGFLDKWSKEKSVRDIWFGEKFRQYRDNLKNNVPRTIQNSCLEMYIMYIEIVLRYIK